MNKTQKYILIGGSAILVLASTAVASSYITRSSLEPERPQQARVQKAPVLQQEAVAQPVQPECDDHNIVGTAGGAVAGALIGNQIGKGSGNTVATIGGMAGGAYLGNQYIPTRGAACR